MNLTAYLVDDEPLALRKLKRMIEKTGRLQVAGFTTDPAEAAARLSEGGIDVLFLDIEMPEMTGFDLARLLGTDAPLIIFTTAYSQYALQAFEVNSIDYLLKPVEQEHLDRALNKIERIRGGQESRPDIEAFMNRLGSVLREEKAQYTSRLASRTGDRVEFVDLARVTHIYAEDKLTYAATALKAYSVDLTIAELEARLDPKRFVRIHRSTIVNIDHVHELHSWFGGKMLLRLKDDKQTELTVAKDRVKSVKQRLEL